MDSEEEHRFSMSPPENNNDPDTNYVDGESLPSSQNSIESLDDENSPANSTTLMDDIQPQNHNSVELDQFGPFYQATPDSFNDQQNQEPLRPSANSNHEAIEMAIYYLNGAISETRATLTEGEKQNYRKQILNSLDLLSQTIDTDASQTQTSSRSIRNFENQSTIIQLQNDINPEEQTGEGSILPQDQNQLRENKKTAHKIVDMETNIDTLSQSTIEPVFESERCARTWLDTLFIILFFSSYISSALCALVISVLSAASYWDEIQCNKPFETLSPVYCENENGAILRTITFPGRDGKYISDPSFNRYYSQERWDQRCEYFRGALYFGPPLIISLIGALIASFHVIRIIFKIIIEKACYWYTRW